MLKLRVPYILSALTYLCNSHKTGICWNKTST
jgi:hypothetical protein